jgi:hypothetical protein
MRFMLAWLFILGFLGGGGSVAGAKQALVCLLFSQVKFRKTGREVAQKSLAVIVRTAGAGVCSAYALQTPALASLNCHQNRGI